jgi:hypothetical protein
MSETVERYMKAWRRWVMVERAMSAARDALVLAARDRDAAWNELAPLVNVLSADEHIQVLELQASELRGDSK